MWAVAGVLSTPGVAIAAAETATQGFDFQQLITAGVTPALVLVLILTGKLYPSGIVDSYRQRAEKAEADRDEFKNIMIDKVVPALTGSADALKLVVPLVQQHQSEPYYDARGPSPSPRRRG